MHPESTGDLLMAAARALRRRHSAVLAGWDVTPAQGRALKLVVALDGPRNSVLAERLRIAPRSATEVVDALASRGLVERRPDPSDRRATTVVATDAGRELLTVVERARRWESERFLAGLTADDRRELHRILGALADG
ncbi:MarR family winged helix-turn-helix transcriptional regulator [Nocardioides sp. SYSU D00038]|uniref:MarR family winged helix-turn-helix transcriptional regulator n=1 Tax=Nocardioides sp. SYSU D00038 TaxID=2812554 RepID=UPI0027DB83CE|nr:MarR family winged helix-turn-helix transcriptional regulator [Nocardioides sp. SYSU D00038]